jgi:hypothetical protein
LVVAILKLKDAARKTRDNKALDDEKDLTHKKDADWERVADFSYAPSDALVKMITDAWADPTFKAKLLDPAQAPGLFQARGFYLQRPVVITEEVYHSHYYMTYPDETVFVLPQDPAAYPAGTNLTETAKLLMACTPNGI